MNSEISFGKFGELAGNHTFVANLLIVNPHCRSYMQISMLNIADLSLVFQALQLITEKLQDSGPLAMPKWLYTLLWTGKMSIKLT
jgi:hypothetical protein